MDARSSNPRYVSGNPNGFARRSDQRYLEEDSPEATRYSNFRYVDREARSSNFAGRDQTDAGFEEGVEDEASGDDVDLEGSMSTNEVTIPELEDMENLVISPVRRGKPKDAIPRCEICQEPIELPDASSSSLARVFDQSETSTASSSRRFTCGHRLHSICYEKLGKAWDAATAHARYAVNPF